MSVVCALFHLRYSHPTATNPKTIKFLSAQSGRSLTNLGPTRCQSDLSELLSHRWKHLPQLSGSKSDFMQPYGTPALCWDPNLQNRLLVQLKVPLWRAEIRTFVGKTQQPVHPPHLCVLIARLKRASFPCISDQMLKFNHCSQPR